MIYDSWVLCLAYCVTSRLLYVSLVVNHDRKIRGKIAEIHSNRHTSLDRSIDYVSFIIYYGDPYKWQSTMNGFLHTSNDALIDESFNGRMSCTYTDYYFKEKDTVAPSRCRNGLIVSNYTQNSLLRSPPRYENVILGSFSSSNFQRTLHGNFENALMIVLNFSVGTMSELMVFPTLT